MAKKRMLMTWKDDKGRTCHMFTYDPKKIAAAQADGVRIRQVPEPPPIWVVELEIRLSRARYELGRLFRLYRDRLSLLLQRRTFCA